MKINKDVFNLFVIISSVISFILGLFYYFDVANGYQYIIFLPFIYLIVYFFILENLRRTPYSFTVYGIILMQWIRFVLMPPVIIMAGNAPGMSYINPSSVYISLAIVLMVYELVITSTFAYWLLRSKNYESIKSYKNNNIRFMGNRYVYFLFILLAIVLVVTVGASNNLLNFGIIPIDGNESNRFGDITDTYLVLVRQIILIALFIIFMWTLQITKKLYDKSLKQIYLNFALFTALLNVGVIVGERRTAQIYTALVCIYLLVLVYPKFKKKIVVTVGLTALVILFFMSVYKFLAAFTQDSYITAIGSSNLDIYWFSRTLQIYFFGPENIAATLEFSRTYTSSLTGIAYDFMRSIFGFSFFLRDDSVMTSAAFNTYIYNEPRLTGHVLSSVGYGVIYFGTIFAPIIAMINIYISSKIELFMKISKSYEMIFLWAYILVRFVTNLFVSTPPLLSYGTMMLGTAGLLFIVSISVKRKTSSEL